MHEGISRLLTRAAVVVGALSLGAPAAEAVDRASVEALVPRLERTIADGMRAFDCPGLAIAIVADDEVVYAKGFGTRSKGGAPVDTKTVFQIGSATKGFLATTMAIAVDRKHFAWDTRVVDLDPEWRLKDPWVTQEFRMFDIIAQRSGLPPYANDLLAVLGLDEAQLIRSLRDVEPVSSFRSTFAYTNITHLAAGRIVASVENAADWEAVVRKDILAPLGMASASVSAAGIEGADNHATGHLWAPEGTTEIPFTELFPYAYAGAGAINANVEDMTRWLRLQLGAGRFEGKTIVSPENLAATHTARVGMTDRLAYAMGWVLQSTPSGEIVWHNGGTPSFGAFVGFVPDKGFGVVVLSNETNVGLPDAVALWTLDRLLGNPEEDIVAAKLQAAREGARKDATLWARPASPRPAPRLAPLAGRFANPSIGTVAVTVRGDTLAVVFPTGAALTLSPWDGDVFTATLAPEGEYAALAANLGAEPQAFAQFQMDATGAPDVLRLTAADGQSYTFERQ
jgi:CubicO group peptidase (beta-lactamase class C family)